LDTNGFWQRTFEKFPAAASSSPPDMSATPHSAIRIPHSQIAIPRIRFINGMAAGAAGSAVSAPLASGKRNYRGPNFIIIRSAATRRRRRRLIRARRFMKSAEQAAVLVLIY